MSRVFAHDNIEDEAFLLSDDSAVSFLTMGSGREYTILPFGKSVDGKRGLHKIRISYIYKNSQNDEKWIEFLIEIDENNCSYVKFSDRSDFISSRQSYAVDGDNLRRGVEDKL